MQASPSGAYGSPAALPRGAKLVIRCIRPCYLSRYQVEKSGVQELQNETAAFRSVDGD